MHVFVAGATGYTGRHLVRLATERSDLRVHAHVRPDSPELTRWRDHFGVNGAKVDMTPWDETRMAERIHAVGPDVVFALLGTTRERGRRADHSDDDATDETYEAVDYGLTSMLLAACRAAGHSPKFVYLSAMGVREGTRNTYLAARAKLEMELRESALPHVIARPAFVSGSDREERRPLERIAARATDTLLGALTALGLSQLEENYASLDGATLAHALLSLGLDPRVQGVFEAAALRVRARQPIPRAPLGSSGEAR